MRLGVYRIAELAMGNVAKHARATVCSVGWSYDELDQQLVMTVTDDGIGFDTSTSNLAASPLEGGFGMTSMRERAQLMGGQGLRVPE